MQKNASKRVHDDDYQKHVDLREKLSKTIRPPVTTLDSRQRFAEKPEDAGFLGRIPSTRSPDDFSRMDSMRASYSTWTLDHLRRRSPDRTLHIGTSRGLSPPRNMEELHGRPLDRTTDDIRSVQYMKKDVFDTSRPMNTTPFIAKSAIPPVPAKPVPPPVGKLPPPNGIGQNISYAVLLLALAASGSWEFLRLHLVSIIIFFSKINKSITSISFIKHQKKFLFLKKTFHLIIYLVFIS